MRAIIGAFLISISAIMLGSPASAQSMSNLMGIDPVDDGNTVLMVEGRGEKLVAPDMAMFSAGVETTGATAREALQANARTTRIVLDAARALGIAERDIQTAQVRVRPVMSDDRDRRGFSSYERDGRSTKAAIVSVSTSDPTSEHEAPPRIIGYRATNSVNIRQRDLDEFGKTIDTLVEAGANRVEGPDFMLDDDRATLDETRQLAMRDARRRAELQAEAAGLRVKRIMLIMEGRDSGLRSRLSSLISSQDLGSDPYGRTPMAPGQLAISSSVNVTFELEPQ